jgi:uncharacterized protein YndB with AHSA1/START domain
MPTRRRIAQAILVTVVALCVVTAGSARAETSAVSPNGFTVTHRFDTAASPARAYGAIHEVGRWWNSSHTWSGNAQNLTLQQGAGGCFCERWPTGSVKHGEVIFAAQDSMIRLRAALGPLQERAVDGVLTFALKAVDGRTGVTVTYRVVGSPDAGLAELAAPVDRVIGEQAQRLARYLDTGRPD